MTLRGIKKRVALFLVNIFNILFCGTKPYFWNIKRNLLNWAGYSIGENTKIVGPLRIFGNLKSVIIVGLALILLFTVMELLL